MRIFALAPQPALRYRRYVSGVLIAVLLIIAGLWNLGGTSPWWDEGWTLSVARTWVERGFYGRLLDGQLAPPGLESAFPTTGLVALSFRLFGVGVWQGRLPIMLCALGALVLMYGLAQRLYNRLVALASLFVLLLMAVHPSLHPLIMGRQVLAEMPMLFCLLAGYTCFLWALRRPLWYLPAAILLWAIALVAKLQAVPFWFISMFVPLVITVAQLQWRVAALLAGGMFGTVIVACALPVLQSALLQGHTAPIAPLLGLYNVTAVVIAPAVRLSALITLVRNGLPALLGVGYACWQYVRCRRMRLENPADIVRLALLTFAGSWLLWFLVLSIGWERYLFPATFVSSLFVAALLHDLTSGFKFQATFQQIGLALRRRHLTRQSAGALLAMMIVITTLPLGMQTLFNAYTVDVDHAAAQTADFLNQNTVPNARIETYETELHFLLDRPYHYPPDQLHVALNRRIFIDSNTPIDYDPLADDPDYLVVGSFGRMWQLYESTLAANAFRLIKTYGAYEIYERIRD
jgi:4-amino-4-deoxy-L-arabinose transferase-like glycosyltransferase